MEKTYLSCADTAKLLRQALKESFPSVKFSVRSSVYSGGASIDVCWTDGPTSRMVKTVTDVFEGSYFDGMIDFKGSRYHTIDGKPTSFGADFIFENRTESDELVERAIAGLVASMPANFADLAAAGTVPNVADYRAGKYWAIQPTKGWSPETSLQSEIRKAAGKRTRFAGPLSSPTLGRIRSAGDDGYGAGTVGTPGSPGGSRGYPGFERRDVATLVEGPGTTQ